MPQKVLEKGDGGRGREKTLFAKEGSLFPVHISSNIASNDLCQLAAEDLPFVIVDKTEPVAVVGSAQVVPGAVGDFIFFEERDQVPHIIFAELEFCVPDGSEFAAPEDFIRMILCEFDCWSDYAAEEFFIHFLKLLVGVAAVVDDFLEIAVVFDIARVRHFSIII